MPKLSLKPKQIEFIKANRLKMSATDMAAKFKVNKDIVARYMRKHGLAVPHKTKMKFRSKAMVGRMTATTKEDKFLKENYLTMPSKRIATNLDRSDVFIRTRLRQLGLKIPKHIIEQRKIDSRIKPGTTPPNKGKKMPKEQYERCKKTMFQKGHLPKNTKEKDGEITVRYDHKNRNGKPYKYIRISIGKWEPLHQHLWNEKYGKPNPDMCLWFKDGNALNCTLENLELITRAENARRNRNAFLELPEEIQTTIKVIKKLKKKINDHGKKQS